MAERLVREVEVAGREGLAWLLGVASLRREALSRVAQVQAWVQAVEVQRGEARDEAAAAEARCDELEQQVARLQSEGDMLSRELHRVSGQLAQKQREAKVEADAARAEIEALRGDMAALRGELGVAFEVTRAELAERGRCIKVAKDCLGRGYTGPGDASLLSAFLDGVHTVVRSLGGEG